MHFRPIYKSLIPSSVLVDQCLSVSIKSNVLHDVDVIRVLMNITVIFYSILQGITEYICVRCGDPEGCHSNATISPSKRS